MTNRRQFLKATALAGVGLAAATRANLYRALAQAAGVGLHDPAWQPLFVNPVPNALHPSFIFHGNNGKNKPNYEVGMFQFQQNLGLVDSVGTPQSTTVWGYGDSVNRRSFPGKTFEVQRDKPITVKWTNNLPNGHLLPVDTSVHWCYSLPTYTGYTLASNGVPVVPHLHGGHTEWQSDGNPEFFFTPNYAIKGPRWEKEVYTYANDQPAANLWYHDHALGITRVNVYAGLAGFYFLRDGQDNGKPNNPLGLPAFPYEAALVIQDRMFTDAGQLFYPGYPGDPYWFDFITEQGLADGDVPQPSILAEFFGDHIMVNGIMWPQMNVEPRNYRLRLLNGSDSRFYVLRFMSVAAGATSPAGGAPIPFYVIGSDQGLGTPAQVDTLVFEPGSRYDVVIDFSQVPAGDHVIMQNLGGDSPFGGDIPGDPAFALTDRVMAFDVVLPLDTTRQERFNPAALAGYGGNPNTVTNTRKVALFEGQDDNGRLQPLLGTAEPTIDALGNTVNGALAWHSPTTENPALGSTEIWEIYNATMDAHPIHLHLVHFQVVNREGFTADVVEQDLLQHDGSTGIGARLENIQLQGSPVSPNAGSAYFEHAPKDVAVALPGQVTRIKATFDKPGHYVWHCHILSHEDHEMMRVMHVGPGA